MKWDSSSSDELLDEERRGTEERLWSSIDSCCSTGGGLGRTGSWRSKLQRWKAVERMEMPRRRERERENGFRQRCDDEVGFCIFLLLLLFFGEIFSDCEWPRLLLHARGWQPPPVFFLFFKEKKVFFFFLREKKKSSF